MRLHPVAPAAPARRRLETGAGEECDRRVSGVDHEEDCLANHTRTSPHTRLGRDSGADGWSRRRRMFNAANTKQVGHDEGFCTRLAPKQGIWECLWTTFLRRGQLTVQGPFYDTRNSVLSITGGTGTYRSQPWSDDPPLAQRRQGVRLHLRVELSQITVEIPRSEMRSGRSPGRRQHRGQSASGLA